MRLARAGAEWAAAAAFLVASAFCAATAATSTPQMLLPGANAKQPIAIEADKLIYYDKEQKAVYSGNVVAIQGDVKLTCSTLTIYMERNAAPRKSDEAATGDAAASDGAPSAGASSVKHMDCAGPVTVLSKTQVATSDSGAYDKAQNKVWLIGNVTLSDGGNVTKGDKLTYDLATGQATVDTGSDHQRVKGLFIPKAKDSRGDDKTAAPQ